MAESKGVRSLGAKQLLGWRGIMWWDDRRITLTGLFAATVLCVAMVATQFNYMVLGHAHVMLVLAPIAACSLIYGTFGGFLVGVIAGLAELIHAWLLPLDYYEKYFMAPWNSVVLFALVGILLGVLFALVDARHDRGARRLGVLALCCIGVSLFFTSYFQLSASIINSLYQGQVPHGLVEQLLGSRESIA